MLGRPWSSLKEGWYSVGDIAVVLLTAEWTPFFEAIDAFEELALAEGVVRYMRSSMDREHVACDSASVIAFESHER